MAEQPKKQNTSKKHQHNKPRKPREGAGFFSLGNRAKLVSS